MIFCCTQFSPLAAQCGLIDCFFISSLVFFSDKMEQTISFQMNASVFSIWNAPWKANCGLSRNNSTTWIAAESVSRLYFRSAHRLQISSARLLALSGVLHNVARTKPLRNPKHHLLNPLVPTHPRQPTQSQVLLKQGIHRPDFEDRWHKLLRRLTNYNVLPTALWITELPKKWPKQ